MNLKILVALFVLLYSTYTLGQDAAYSALVSQLKKEVETTQGTEKLKLLDSLTRLVEFNEDLGYTPLAHKTIALAISEKNYEIATILTGDLIYYNSNLLGDLDGALQIFDDFKTKNIDIDKIPPTPLCNYYLYAGDANFNKGSYDEAIMLFTKAKELAIKAGNKNREGHATRRLGYTKGSKGLFAEAAQDIQKAILLFKETQDTINLIRAKESMSVLYSQNQFYKEAQQERDEAMQLIDENDPVHLGNHLNASVDYQEQGKNKLWLKSLKKAIEASKTSSYFKIYEPRLTGRLVMAYIKNDSLNAAKALIKIMDADKEKFATGQFRDDFLEAKKHIALASNEYDEAIQLASEHLTLKKEKESYVELYNAEKFLANAYKAKGDINRANYHDNNYFRIKDSINSVQNVKSLSYYQTLYETEKRDNTIKEQKLDLVVLEQKNRTRNQWFLFLGILTALGVGGFVLYKNYKQKLQRRLAVEKLRTQISADLHDDVGSLLTGLSMQTEILAKQVPEEQKFKLERVSAISKDAMLKMRDAVWAMDARKDNWQSLTDRMNEFAIENLQTKDIAYTLDVNNIELSKAMQGAVRQNLYLIFKEAIANVLKHSNATKVNVHLKKHKNNFIMDIADNGSSQKKLSKAGQGLTNMTLRATQLLGNLNYRNDNGFKITVAIPAS